MSNNHFIPNEKENKASVKFLVVDDDKITRMALQMSFDSLGANYEIVETGKEAVAKVKSGDYQVVISDINMPEMDGYQVAAEVKKYAKENNKNIKVYALTASEIKEVEARYKKSGFDGVLLKECGNDFTNFIKEIMENHKE